MGRQIKIDLCNLERTFQKSLKDIPSQIAKRGIAIADEISHHKVNPSVFDGKRLHINKKILTVKVGNRHRLLMDETETGFEPWQCISHERYNKLYMRISNKH